MTVHRINIDGLSNTKTAVLNVEAKAGTAVELKDGKFVVATDPANMVCIVVDSYINGLQSKDTINSGSTVTAEVAEEGRLLAVLAGAGSYKEGDLLGLDAGKLTPHTAGAVFAYVNKDTELDAEGLLVVRVANKFKGAE